MVLWLVQRSSAPPPLTLIIALMTRLSKGSMSVNPPTLIGAAGRQERQYGSGWLRSTSVVGRLYLPLDLMSHRLCARALHGELTHRGAH